MGLSALGTALALALLPPSGHLTVISRMFYPLGFIVVIIGRSQLFTENTLYPVALVLAEGGKEFWNTLRLWAVVLPSNVLGAFAFASLASLTPALSPDIVHALAQLGLDALAHTPASIFWSGVMGGWIIALAAWLVSGSHSITGSVAVIWMLTFIVGLGNFAHCIAASGEILTAILTHQAPWTAYPHWMLFAVLGNICGGVGMVTVLEYGQVIAGGDKAQRELGRRNRASPHQSRVLSRSWSSPAYRLLAGKSKHHAQNCPVPRDRQRRSPQGRRPPHARTPPKAKSACA